MWDEQGDLFEVGAEWSLCHCVSKDLDMGAGIAVAFKEQFGGVEELQRQHIDVGGVGVLQKKKIFVYYLVTKNNHGDKPILEALRTTLVAMKAHVVENGVRRLAMPHIGCGLDRLKCSTVQELVLEVFDDDDIEILARCLDPKPKQKIQEITIPSSTEIHGPTISSSAPAPRMCRSSAFRAFLRTHSS